MTFPTTPAIPTARGRCRRRLYYARLTQRLLAALTAPTKAGKLYEVDLRLRPSGRKGPLATQFSAFRLYQANEAETWEHMALTRARVVAGDKRLGDEIGGDDRRRSHQAARQGEARQGREGDARPDRAREGRPGPVGPQARLRRADRRRIRRPISDPRRSKRAFRRCSTSRPARRSPRRRKRA